jgi:DNA-binding NarL/FixJ family response regulator
MAVGRALRTAVLHASRRSTAQSSFAAAVGRCFVDRRDVVERRQVLIVDDNAQLRHLMYALLQSDGRFEVVGEAADGAEALRLIDDLAPELMLLDLSMPGMDGIEVLERMNDREHAPSTVVLSGYLDDALREQVLAAGAALCLEKGVDFTELTDRLAAAARCSVPDRSR